MGANMFRLVSTITLISAFGIKLELDKCITIEREDGLLWASVLRIVPPDIGFPKKDAMNGCGITGITSPSPMLLLLLLLLPLLLLVDDKVIEWGRRNGMGME